MQFCVKQGQKGPKKKQNQATPMGELRKAKKTYSHNTPRRRTPRHDAPRHGTPRHGTARHDRTRHDTARHATRRHATPGRATTRHATARHGTRRHATIRHATRVADGSTHATEGSCQSGRLTGKVPVSCIAHVHGPMDKDPHSVPLHPPTWTSQNNAHVPILPSPPAMAHSLTHA